MSARGAVTTDDAAIVRRGRLARRSRERTIMLVLSALVVVVSATTLCVGSISIPIGDVVATLAGQGDSRNSFVVLQLRLPRLTLGIVAAIAFSLAGALFQSLLNNALASPDVIGISGGASVAAVFAMLILGLDGFAVSAAAFLGALAVAVVIYLLTSRGGLTGYRFVLVGIAIAFMAQGALGYLLTRADVRDAQSALRWMVGSVSSARWDDIAITAACLVALVPLVAILVPRLRILQLGDDSASGLGLRTNRTRILLLLLAVSLAAVGTAAVGPIAFVAFVSAPIARRLTGTGGLALLPSALVGIIVVTSADFIAQHLLPGGVQVPAGIITGVIGAPYLLWLLATSDRSRRGS